MRCTPGTRTLVWWPQDIWQTSSGPNNRSKHLTTKRTKGSRVPRRHLLLRILGKPKNQESSSRPSLHSHLYHSHSKKPEDPHFADEETEAWEMKQFALGELQGLGSFCHGLPQLGTFLIHWKSKLRGLFQRSSYVFESPIR